MAWNPLRSFTDHQERVRQKAALLALCKEKIKKPGDMIQLGSAPIDVQHADRREDAGRWTQVLEEFCRENRQYSIVLWGGVPAITTTKSIDALPDDIRKINEAAGFIKRGGEF